MAHRLASTPNGDTVFKCCGKSFKRRKDLNLHKTLKHQKNKEPLFTGDVTIYPEIKEKLYTKEDYEVTNEIDKTTFESGATSSKQLPRYDLIPRVMLEILAERYTLGATKHGDFNYRKGFHDKDFIIDRINHLVEHFNAFLSPRTKEEWDDDNIGAILWAAAFLAEVRQADPGLLMTIRSERGGV